MAGSQIVDIKTQPDLKKVQKSLGKLHDKAPQVMANAINRAATNVKSNMGKAAAKRYVVKQGDVKSTIRVKKANRSSLSAEITSSAKRKISLAKFKASPKEPRPQNPPEYYKSKVLKESGLKPLTGTSTLSKGFYARFRSGHEGIFERTGKLTRNGRPQLKELYGPDIPSMIGQKENVKFILDEGTKMLQNRLDHEIKRALEVGK